MIVVCKVNLHEFKANANKKEELASAAQRKARRSQDWLLLITSCTWPV